MYWAGENGANTHNFTALHLFWVPPRPFTDFSGFTPRLAPLISPSVVGGHLQSGAKPGENQGETPQPCFCLWLWLSRFFRCQRWSQGPPEKPPWAFDRGSRGQRRAWLVQALLRGHPVLAGWCVGAAAPVWTCTPTQTEGFCPGSVEIRRLLCQQGHAVSLLQLSGPFGQIPCDIPSLAAAF